jgi:hypothetical protein
VVKIESLSESKFKSSFVDEVVNKKSAVALIVNTANSCPFKWSNSAFMCFYCDECCSDFESLQNHTLNSHHRITEPEVTKAVDKLRKQQKIKINFTSLTCKICDASFNNFKEMKVHLAKTHEKPVDMEYDGVFPYKIQGGSYGCVLCGICFSHYAPLNRHMNSHFPFYVCNHCGIGYASGRRLKEHKVTHHEDRSYSCEICLKTFPSAYRKKIHINRVHLKMHNNKCTLCTETFTNYNEKVKHLKAVHGKKEFCGVIVFILLASLTHNREVIQNIQYFLELVPTFLVSDPYINRRL